MKIFFLDLIRSSHLNTRTSISSVLGKEYTEPATEDEKQLRNGGIGDDVDRMYEELDDVEEEEEDELINGHYLTSESDGESEKDNSEITFSPFCEKVTRKKDLPTPLFAGRFFFAAREAKNEIISFFSLRRCSTKSRRSHRSIFYRIQSV